MTDVAEMLRQAGVTELVQPPGKENFWIAGFDIDGARETAVLVLPDHGEYYLALTPIISAQLDATLDTLPASVLSVLIRQSSAVPFAKVEYLDSDDFTAFAATSECSSDHVTGVKLRRRLEACATLAARIVHALEALANSG